MKSRKGQYSLVFRKEDKAVKLTISALMPGYSVFYFRVVTDSIVRVVTRRALRKPQVCTASHLSRSKGNNPQDRKRVDRRPGGKHRWL